MNPSRKGALALSASLAFTTVLAMGPIDAIGAPAAPAIMVTEIAPDNASYDEYEYFEIHNTTSQAIDLDEQKYSFAYTYEDSSDRAKDVPLSVENLTIQPNETVVLWLSYTAKNIDSFAHSEADFRSTWSMNEDARIVRVTGQPGMANKGERGIRVLKNDQVQSWSYYPGGFVATGKVAEFSVSNSDSMNLLASQTEPTPGSVRDEQFVLADSPELEEVEAPKKAAPLIITELLPDSDNISGSDAYEFIEIANTTSEPIDFSDYTITYLYPSSQSSANWPSVPSDVVIEPGKTLVFWIKNGANDDLSVADFNNRWGTNLTLGKDIVEIESGGMANGGPRGVQIQTNTGQVINRAFYNMGEGKEVVTNQGFQFKVDEADLSTQERLQTSAATPGSAIPGQLPQPLIEVVDDTQAPKLNDKTSATADSEKPLKFDFEITDDQSVKTVTLKLTSNVKDFKRTQNLEADENDASSFSYEIPVADLTGKDWFEYTLTYTDGKNTKTTDPRRLTVKNANAAPLRINHQDNDWVSATTDLIAATDSPTAISMQVDGKDVQTQSSLESDPVFAFEVTQTDTFFRNGVLAPDGEILRIFDEGTYSNVETISVPVPIRYIDGNKLTVSIYAGTKAKPAIDENENNDDFEVRSLRLVLPDGRTLKAAGYETSKWLRMGDSTGKLDYVDATFELPSDSFAGARYAWDTTKVEDGEHVVTASADVSGKKNAKRILRVDNTGPEISFGFEDNQQLQGEFTIDPNVKDSGIGVDQVSATLDGEKIALPHKTSSLELAPGSHDLKVAATDKLGNESERSITFKTPEENPQADDFSPSDGSKVNSGDVALSAKITDAANDKVKAEFLEGYKVDLADIKSSSGTVNDAAAKDRAVPRALTPDEVSALATEDQVVKEATSSDAFPYELFEVPVSADSEGGKLRIKWSGSAESNAQVSMRVKSKDGSWREIDRHKTGSGTGKLESFELSGLVDIDEFAVDGSVKVLVQHSDGWSGPSATDRNSEIAVNNPEDEPRNSYDFTLAWESDTQYYNERDDYYPNQVAIHDFLLDQRENMNIQYLFHTGDIVDDFDESHQWRRADAQYKRLDEAGFPYGVLAGNHDVGHKSNDYREYSKHFGESRFASNPWYGGSYADNRGHYDLFSAGGIDFIAVYQGWGPDDAEIAWMNEVLSKHSDRIAIINLHEFMLTTGGLGPIPQRVLDEVVATNPNVKMVFSGHYHDAFTRLDEFDDDGDGVADRTVTSMLFDYQALPNGGQGYLRLLHFDNEGKKLMVRTYSPTLDRYNSDNKDLLGSPSNPYEYQHFDVPYSQLGIAPAQRVLASDSLSVDVLTEKLIGSAENVSTPGTAEVVWKNVAAGQHSWYLRVSDANGGQVISPILSFEAVAVEQEPSKKPEEPGTTAPSENGSTDPGKEPGTQQPQSPETSASGDPSASPDKSAGTASQSARPGVELVTPSAEASKKPAAAKKHADSNRALPVTGQTGGAAFALGLIAATGVLVAMRNRKKTK